VLAEMDGFEKNENIIIIGATNHEKSLDPAAIRPGRFDKKIHVPHPDLNGRTEIFDLYLNKISKAEDINSRKLA
jgi:ATP-dependent 26S proteasome regulatory subunit